MREYLTIKEVVLLTGKSDKTIRNNFTSKKEELNRLSNDDIIIKKGREYGILKSYVVDFYQLKTGRKLVTSSNETGKKLITSSNKTGKKDDALLVSLRSQLKESREDVKYLRTKLDEESNKTKNLINQNNQSQILIADLQQRNTALQIGLKEKEDMPGVKQAKELNLAWLVLSFSLLIVIAVYIVIQSFN